MFALGTSRTQAAKATRWLHSTIVLLHVEITLSVFQLLGIGNIGLKLIAPFIMIVLCWSAATERDGIILDAIILVTPMLRNRDAMRVMTVLLASSIVELSPSLTGLVVGTGRRPPQTLMLTDM